jgi:alginate O-acetyltransferase complex protein AlgI
MAEERFYLVFSSLFFLCVFLPVNLLFYFIIRNNTWRNWILVLTSLFFYAWGEPRWISIMILCTLVNYINGRICGRYQGKWQSKAALTASVVINLAALGFFKYSGFFIENLNALTGLSIPFKGIALPIGISFYTFQSISYVIDVHRGEVEDQKSFWKLLLYVSLFHQLIAGPIVRYQDIALEIENRRITAQAFSQGVGRFIIGLGKKVLIANMAGDLSENFLGTDYSMLPVTGAWLGILLFALQIYFDFSGYSDMAIGLGKMYGFNYKENFNYPYIAGSATEFWRRWHISLSSFFRDYVYIPLGGNRKHQIRNLLVVWLLTGFWHGASWNFIFWGLYYFIFILLEKLFLGKLLGKIPAVFSRIYLLLLVIIGWVFFYHENLSEAFCFLGVMFGKAASFTSGEVSILFMSNLIFLIIAIISATPLLKKLYEKARAYFAKSPGKVAFLDNVFKPVVNILVLVLCLVFLVGESYNPFLYFRF